MAPFLALGLVVSGYLGYALAASPIRVVQHPHALQYLTGVHNGDVWAVLYVVAVIGPALMSGYPSIVAFGVVNLVGLVCVAVLLFDAFDSVWCVYAGLASVLVLVHMWRRRHLPDPHRLHGHSTYDGTFGSAGPHANRSRQRPQSTPGGSERSATY